MYRQMVRNSDKGREITCGMGGVFKIFLLKMTTTGFKIRPYFTGDVFFRIPLPLILTSFNKICHINNANYVNVTYRSFEKRQTMKLKKLVLLVTNKRLIVKREK
jgi:hypothetical protein